MVNLAMRYYKRFLLCLTLFFWYAVTNVNAQEEAPFSEYQAASFTMDSAASLAAANKYQMALEKYQEATDKLNQIQKEYPNGEVSFLVTLKLEKCRRNIDVIHGRLKELEQIREFENEKAILGSQIGDLNNKISIVEKELKETKEKSARELEKARQDTISLKEKSSEQIRSLSETIEELKRLKAESEHARMADAQKAASLAMRLEDLKVKSKDDIAKLERRADKNLETTKRSLTAVFNKEKLSLREKIKVLEEQNRTFAGQVAFAKQNEINLINQSKEKEMALMGRYRKKEEILENKLSEMRLRVNALEGQRKGYLDKVLSSKEHIDNLIKELEEYKTRNTQLKEKSMDDEKEIASLRSQIEDFKGRMRGTEQKVQEALSEQLERQKKNLTEKFEKEKAMLSKELANSRTRLKLAKDNLDSYLGMLRKFEKGSSLPAARSAIPRQSEEISYATDEYEVMEPQRGKQGRVSLPEGSFTAVGAISSVLLTDNAGRAYIELFPDYADFVNKGSKLYLVKDGSAKAQLLVIDMFLSLNSIVAEFPLENKPLIKERGVVSVLN